MDESRLKIAIAAMQGSMGIHLSDEDRAAWAFRQADAMIAEGLKGTGFCMISKKVLAEFEAAIAELEKIQGAQS